MKRYILKPIEELQKTTFYRNSINMEWKKGIIELSVMTMIITDENKTTYSDGLGGDVKFTLISPNFCPVPNTFLVEVSDDYMPDRPKWRKYDHCLEGSLLSDLLLDYVEPYYTTILGDVYSDHSNYNVEMERKGTAGVILYYDLLGRKVARYVNDDGNINEFQWDQEFLERVKPAIKEAQSKYLESKFENYLGIWE